VREWQAENRFPIRFYFQENQGKHIAWNRAADLARGEYFLCADSDDEFVPETLQQFMTCLESIPGNERHRSFGVAALCKNRSGQIVGEEFPRHISDSDFIELYFKYKIRGEKWYCGRTEIYRVSRFSEEFTGSYLPEGTLWFRIAKKYKVRLLNEPLRIYHSETESTCNSRTYPRNASGMRSLSLMFLCDFMDHWRTSRPVFLLHVTTYLRSCFHLGIPILEQIRDLNNLPAKILWFLMLPKGFALYLHDSLVNHRSTTVE
jgi:glycosyltransferase involved in cell wall biosynthesis